MLKAVRTQDPRSLRSANSNRSYYKRGRGGRG